MKTIYWFAPLMFLPTIIEVVKGDPIPYWEVFAILVVVVLILSARYDYIKMKDLENRVNAIEEKSQVDTRN